MDKKDILSKAKEEPDEMEFDIQAKSLGISTIIIPLLCLFYVIIRISTNYYIISDLIVLVLSQILIQQIYQYVKMKNKKYLLFIILTFILTCIFFINFLNEVGYERFINFKK